MPDTETPKWRQYAMTIADHEDRAALLSAAPLKSNKGMVVDWDASG